MTDDNSDTNLVDIDENLEDFEAKFYNKEEKTEEPVEDTEDDTLATEEDTDAPEGDEDPDTEEDSEDEGESDSDEDESEPEAKSKGKGKKSFQERINELTRKAREEERAKIAEQHEKQELLRRLESLEASLTKDSKSQTVKENLPQGAPSPDAVGEDGEPIYPLGEFDPTFIRDLTKFTIEEERKSMKEEAAREAETQKIEAAKAELKNSWENKLTAVEEEIPEIREHITDLVGAFQNLEPSYGEYLAMTIMQSDVGPEIMEYLSQNIGEAQKIVGSGPTAATLAIGRLEAKLARTIESDTPNKKVSDAPAPPARMAKGRRQTGTVKPDTEDLSAFEREFYKK